MTRDAYLHEIDLGRPLSDEEMTAVLQGSMGTEAVRAVLQLLRNMSADMDREGRQPLMAAAADAGDWRAHHDGAAAAHEAAFWNVYRRVHAPAAGDT